MPPNLSVIISELQKEFVHCKMLWFPYQYMSSEDDLISLAKDLSSSYIIVLKVSVERNF